MTKITEHPAASLPEAQRLDYLKTVASMSLVDGFLDKPELDKLARLAAVLGVTSEEYKKLADGLAKGKAEITAGAIDGFRKNEAVRSSLMMDSIVIAFSDGKLERTESAALSELAVALDYPRAEVTKMASYVEKVMFKREHTEERTLSKELDEGPAAAPGFFGWIKGVFGG